MTDKFYRIILASLLVTSTWWRHCLTLHFFSVNTVPVIPITIWVKETTAFPFVLIYGKCPAERAGNDIAEKLNSEIFWRSTLVWSAFTALTFLPGRTPGLEWFEMCFRTLKYIDHVQVPSQFVISRVALCIKMLSHTICNKLTCGVFRCYFHYS